MHSGRQQKDSKKTGAQTDQFVTDFARAGVRTGDRKITVHQIAYNTLL